jgi:hypothetical protein
LLPANRPFSSRLPSHLPFVSQNVIAPEICSKFTWTVGEFENSLTTTTSSMNHGFSPSTFALALAGGFSQNPGGQLNPETRKTCSHIGGAASIPLSPHDSIKINYSTGAFIRFGGDYQNLSGASQYPWIGKP